MINRPPGGGGGVAAQAAQQRRQPGGWMGMGGPPPAKIRDAGKTLRQLLGRLRPELPLIAVVVAVGTASDASMFWAIFPAAPRSGVALGTGCSAGRWPAVGAAGSAAGGPAGDAAGAPPPSSSWKSRKNSRQLALTELGSLRYFSYSSSMNAMLAP